MKRYVVSDLHLLDRSKADDFQENEAPLRRFLQGIPDKSLILCGDIFDLLQADLKEIEKSYGKPD